MIREPDMGWRRKVVSPEKVLPKIRPGMSIFVGTGIAEPRTLVKALMASTATNLQDLELIQLVSLGDTLSLEEKYSRKFRLKTFFAGFVVDEAITAGRVDLIPSRFSRIPSLIQSGTISVDVAFVQITPPDEAGYSSLGVALDAARQAMEKADLVVGEINDQVPRTLGDTFVHVDEFDFFVEAAESPLYFPRWPRDPVYDQVAANVASLIQDGSCIAFSIGRLFEALAPHLARKKNLGVHSPFFTDALMDLVKSGAVTNRKKENFRGKSLAAYAMGSKDLMKWLHRNPLIEFQGIEVVTDPQRIGGNDRFVVILPARKVDFTGGVILPSGKGNVGAGLAEAQEFFMGASLSRGGMILAALPSRNLKGASNIILSVEGFSSQWSNREAVDLIVTEYGVAALTGRTIRERALALIDIAHPDDRVDLVSQAKKNRILYADQIYLPESGRLYPSEIAMTETFREGLIVRFRAIKPSDVDEMRRLFYRFSDEAVYYRYFSPVKTMPHAKMQEYVNVDYRKSMSIVGLVGEPGHGKIIAEARYVMLQDQTYADVAFVVDEAYQGRGLASFMFTFLIKTARERGIQGFTADVLATNASMLKVFTKSPFPVKAVLDGGIYELTIPFKEEKGEGNGRTEVRSPAGGRKRP